MEHKSSPGSFHLGYVPALDGLRGIAVVAVVLFHFDVPFPTGGFLGVDLFFVLSGFLITSLLLEEWDRFGTISLLGFYARRALRLLPGLCAFLLFFALFTIPYETAFGFPSTAPKLIAVSLGYMTNWALILGYVQASSIGHLWSLAVEEQFYLVWPVFVLLLLRNHPPRHVPVYVVVALLGAFAILQAAMWNADGGQLSTYFRIYWGSDTRAVELLAGCLAAFAINWNLLPRSIWSLRVIKVGSVIASVFLCFLFLLGKINDLAFGGFLFNGGMLLLAIATCTIVLQTVLAPTRVTTVLLANPVLVAIGRVSYGLYLWHRPIAYLLVPYGWGLAVALGIPLAIATTVLSYRYIEHPALRFKQRFRQQLIPSSSVAE